MPPSTPLLSALVPQDGIAALFADLWVLGGSSLRGTTDFQKGLELATYPYALRAVPVDGDCRMLLCTILFVYHIDWQLP